MCVGCYRVAKIIVKLLTFNDKISQCKVIRFFDDHCNLLNQMCIQGK